MANLTTATAITLARLLLDKAESPYYTDAEITLFLELGIKEFINENYKKFEINQATRDNLRTIVKTSTTLTQATPDQFDISSLSDYRHFLSFEIVVGNRVEYVKIIQLDDYLAIKKDPFNKPSESNVIGVMEDNKIKVYKDNVNTINSHVLTYLSWNESSDNIASLPDHTHEDIVNITVRKLMGSVKDESYKSQAAEELKNKI
tara:strand:+ start:1140 stop:1748 length:609 start_codon:yes stop_codon:yes gene_type:complete